MLVLPSCLLKSFRRESSASTNTLPLSSFSLVFPPGDGAHGHSLLSRLLQNPCQTVPRASHLIFSGVTDALAPEVCTTVYTQRSLKRCSFTVFGRNNLIEHESLAWTRDGQCVFSGYPSTPRPRCQFGLAPTGHNWQCKIRRPLHGSLLHEFFEA